ncbi:MAG: hypothetical protein J0I84_05000 [Terrimonas sp.]|nr:hypothetical protein [Terrimonas sp.]
MLNHFRKSTLLILSGIFMLVLTIAACNSQEAQQKEEATTVKPVDTAPAVDTTHMDTATTRPVKGGN